MTSPISDECWIRAGISDSDTSVRASSQHDDFPARLSDVLQSNGVEFIFIRRAVTEPWLDVMEKRLDYLKAGVKVVVILDPKTKSASVFRPTDRQEMLEADQTLTIPDVLPGFALVVGKLFE